jgi:flagellar basal-body rod protein FlgB
MKSMSTDGIFNKTFSLLGRSLDLRILNQRVLAANIANLDTPNYKAIELAVSEEMIRENETTREVTLTRTHVNHLPIQPRSREGITLKAARAPEFSLRGDGNTVDIDRAMGQMAKNTLLFNAATQLISRKFKGLKNAISGGAK